MKKNKTKWTSFFEIRKPHLHLNVLLLALIWFLSGAVPFFIYGYFVEFPNLNDLLIVLFLGFSVFDLVLLRKKRFLLIILDIQLIEGYDAIKMAKNVLIAKGIFIAILLALRIFNVLL